MIWRLLRLACLILAVAGPAAAQGLSLDPRRGVLTLAPVVERVSAGVVAVASESLPTPTQRDPFFRRYFNLPGPETREEPDGSPAEGPDATKDESALLMTSAGSGVVVDAAQGLILTNAHVVRGGRRIVVRLPSGRTFDATLVGSDPRTEVAVLRIPAQGLTAVPLGRSADLRVGDFVLAIGNPFGLGQSVTSGIISGLGRSVAAGDRFEDFIQTDASINPGNSGGALINSKGELVGINTAILSASGGNIGIGFAIPIDMARGVMAQILRYGEVRRGLIGIRVGAVSPETAEGLGLPAGTVGALIADVVPDSPAAAAGLRSGDVITALDGVPLSRWTDVRNRLGLLERDTPVRVTYRRGADSRTITVRIGAS